MNMMMMIDDDDDVEICSELWADERRVQVDGIHQWLPISTPNVRATSSYWTCEEERRHNCAD